MSGEVPWSLPRTPIFVGKKSLPAKESPANVVDFFGDSMAPKWQLYYTGDQPKRKTSVAPC